MEIDLEYNMDFDYGDYSNYTVDNSTAEEEHSLQFQSTCFRENSCITLVVINSLIFILGVLGNGIVIWIAGFKMTKSVNTTWYLSLAVSDFLVCAIHPFNTAHLAIQDWVFGLFLCKVTSFMMFVNMFSSIFLLVFISMDRCVSVMFPVWAQNHRTVRTASFIVVVAWLCSVVLSIPSLVYRNVQEHMGITHCYNSYVSDKHSHTAIAVSRFVFGFVVPFIVIIVCYSVITLRLMGSQISRSSSKPLKVMSALILTFFICWLPYHVYILLELTQGIRDPHHLKEGLRYGTTLALANSCLNPVLYVFMGNDFRRKFKNSVLSKIENAMGEDHRSSRYLSRSSSVDTRASTHI